jgi:hypothetical protein
MDDDRHEPDPPPVDLHRRRARIHSALVLALVVCPAGFGFELWRALSGNTLSWAYVFEWPIFLAVAVYLWRVMLRQADGEPVAPRRDDAIAEDDADLVAWRRYVAEAADHDAVGDDPVPGPKGGAPGR